jgi:transcriptional regulator with XRE-family HTH domain
MSEHRGTFGDYLRRALDGKQWTAADLARASGVSESNIGRYLKGTVGITVENARLVAAAIDRPIIEVLVAAGILRPDEIEVKVVTRDVGSLGHREMLAELDRRLTRAAGGDVMAELSAMAHDPEMSEDIVLPGSGPRSLRKDS